MSFVWLAVIHTLSPPTNAMSCATCKPTQNFFSLPAPTLLASTAHLPPWQVPMEQSELLLQLGAVSQVPSMQSRPALHSDELSHCTPQSLVPPPLPSEQPGKSGGQISLAAQRGGASASS
ncbi:MAG: hypothetical protein QM756_31860 [Polyangiaceae bacterium]